MSTPPVQPPNPNEPESGGQPPAPRYGENAPQFGQPATPAAQPTPPAPPAPQYGQVAPPAPQYGQNAPQYGENPPPAPQYGQNAPQYGENPPSFGQNAPQYGEQGSPAPQYGQNPPPFGQNPPQAPGYGQQPFGQQYGQSPYAQYPSEQPAATGGNGVPQLVNISFWLLIASGIVYVISMLVGIGQLDDPLMRNTFEEAMESGGAAGQVSYEDLKGIIAGTLVVFAIIGAALYALVAILRPQGQELGPDPRNRVRGVVRLRPFPGAELRNAGNADGHRSHRAAVPAGCSPVLPQAAAVCQPVRPARKPFRPLA